jgi:putative NADH-flavin reductase
VPYIEVVRKVILAVKVAGVKYFVFVGGAGSLVVPGTHECLADHPGFFPAYRKQIAESDAHVRYMEDRLGPLGSALRSYRNARLAEKAGTATPADVNTIQTYEEAIRKADRASDYIKAGRASLLFFEGNVSFPWTFVSPSPLYRPGPRTGAYELTIDYVPLKGEQKGEGVLDARLTGISAADLGVAIADEIENQRLVHKHWTATGDLSDDTLYASYLNVKDI